MLTQLIIASALWIGTGPTGADHAIDASGSQEPEPWYVWHQPSDVRRSISQR